MARNKECGNHPPTLKSRCMLTNWVILRMLDNESISCLSNSLLNGNWEAYPFLANAWDLGESFQDCCWSWVPRSANMAVDSLASFGNLEMCNVVWVNRPPSSLVFVLNNDGNKEETEEITMGFLLGLTWAHVRLCSYSSFDVTTADNNHLLGPLVLACRDLLLRPWQC
ncbi:hypothetical protein DVH24_005339 [Malus domestica]|uniref:RNase H type-1 domain-containing protein n=1 Tax=Malus domestica TaxID=3750 RepID=A0A498KJH1_MALDO|nr:hypothetical protein DVH24_005339 [Malus domestica]